MGELEHYKETAQHRSEALRDYVDGKDEILKERIEAQDRRVADLGTWFGLLGVLIGVITIATAVAAFFAAGSRARESARSVAREAISERAVHLEAEIDRLQTHVGAVEGEARSALNRIQQHEAGVRTKADEAQKAMEKYVAARQTLPWSGQSDTARTFSSKSPDVEAVLSMVTNKPEPERTVADWITLGSSMLETQDYSSALEYFRRAARTP